MNKKYIVRLDEEEREQLKAIVSKGKTSAPKIKHAHILLEADADGPNKADEKIAKTFRCHTNTVRNVRQRFVEEGLEEALKRKKRLKPSREKILDGRKEARLIALSLSKPPAGYARWSLRLLAGEMVALEVVDNLSHETVRRTLKKMF